MPTLSLYIGNKNYSSWSMRPWLMLRQTGIEFREVKVRFDSFADNSVFKTTMAAITPTGTVPVLVDGNLVIWDSLAIAEYLAEQFPDTQLWPENSAQRARARSICAEMHAGFKALRNACPMNIEASLAETGALIWRDQPAVQQDVTRLTNMWTDLLEHHGGPMLFGHFSIADAFFAPIVMRLHTYALPVSPRVAQYMKAVQSLESVQTWIREAKAEQDFRSFEEPYRLAP